MNRRDEILQVLNERGQVTYAELEVLFPSVSNMTLRRDLIGLEKEGFAIRTRGGAVSRMQVAGSLENAYNTRAKESVAAKIRIASKAKTLIRPGRSLYIDSGTTMMYLAREIPDETLFIITSGPNIAMEISRNYQPTILLVGGSLNRNNYSVSGAYAQEMIRRINIDMAFLVASGYDRENGFTCGSINECELKMTVMQKARQTVMLMDSSKVGRSMPYTFATFDDIDVFITDDEMDKSVLDEARRKSVIVL